MAYLAAKQVTIGYDEEDPDNPGRKKTVVYEQGQEVDVTGIDNVEALVDNGYLVSDEVPDEAPAEGTPAEEAPAEEAPAEGGEGE